MPFAPGPDLQTTTVRTRPVRYALALCLVAGTTAFRQLFDPLLLDQAQYFFYLPAVLLVAWWAGIEAGVLAGVASALCANYFFVPPRYELNVTANDASAMIAFTAVCIGLVWLVARWRRAECALRDLHAQTTAVLHQMPVGVVICDTRGKLLFGNLVAERVLGGRIEMNKDDAGEQPHQAALARALNGETVIKEASIVAEGTTRRLVETRAAPVRNINGRITSAVVAISDVTEQRQAAAALRSQAEELQAILDTVPAVVLTVRDPAGLRVDGNRFAAEVLRMPVGSNLSKGVPDMLQPPFRLMRTGKEIPPGQLPTRAAITSQAEIRDYEFNVVHGDGTTRTLFGNATPLHDEDGNTRGAVAAFLDITERKQMEESLRDANRLKDEFLATLSHELRTPLTAILGWSDMLRRGQVKPSDGDRAIEAIYRNAKVQSELINDVLDVSRIISGKVHIETKPVDPSALLASAVEAVRAAADAKGVTIITQTERAPFPMSGDPTRIQQVFWNLLSNAVKFTPAGGHVSVSLGFVDSNMQLKVADTGTGISPDFLPHVFERFRQRDSSSTRKHSGLGLGLAIVRHLVELHGGTVRADSAGEGKGAVFTVTLPAQRFEERRREGRPVIRPGVFVEPAPDETPALEGVRVLVVDDERDTREVAASVLRHHGAAVSVAASGAQALQQLDLFDPTVLLVDIAMPDMDGYALVEKLKKASGQKAASVPAIAFTAYAREEDRHRALKCGFHAHLAKPVDSHTLVRAIAEAARDGHQVA